MADSSQRFYDEEEAEQILRLAMSLSPSPEGMHRQELLAAAAELGISSESVELAEQQFLERQAEKNYQKQFDLRARREFRGHLTSFLIVSAFLFLINWRTGLSEFWCVYPLLAWGIGVAVHGAATFWKSGAMYRSGYERWRVDRVNRESPVEGIKMVSGPIRDLDTDDHQILIGIQARIGPRLDRRP